MYVFTVEEEIAHLKRLELHVIYWPSEGFIKFDELVEIHSNFSV
jgi:hypothetical protein